MEASKKAPGAKQSVPWLGARKFARKLIVKSEEMRAQRDAARSQLGRISAMGRELVAEVKKLRAEQEALHKEFEIIGALPVAQLQTRKLALEKQIAEQTDRLNRERAEITAAWQALEKQVAEARQSIVETRDLALDLLPNLPSFIRRVCSSFAPVWGVLQTRLV